MVTALKEIDEDGHKIFEIVSNQIERKQKNNLVLTPIYNKINNRLIENCGKIHFGSVGIGLMYANHSEV